MIRSSWFTRLASSIASMVFAVSVILFCSFGIISVFQVLSAYGLDDMSQLSSKDADGIVATITGISINEDSIEADIVSDLKNIIYSMDNKYNYTFDDATVDAKNVLSNVFDDFDSESIESGFIAVSNSISKMFADSKTENVFK